MMRLAAPLLLAACLSVAIARSAEPPPNIVLILCDNLGYGDVGCYGSQKHRTPHIDRLAAAGMRFTDCYAASGVCTPSRAALLTGCYPPRVGLHRSDTGASVLQPVASIGLHPDEVTLAEVLKPLGYATACIGKWHLGDQPPFLPTRQGFDSYLGIPYSDDMTPREGKPWPDLPLLKNEAVIEAPVDRNLLTKRYTRAAVEFIREHRQRPFFLYLAHAMPGSTQHPFASEQFRGKSANGAWGDSVEEIDWSTGEIMAALKELDLDNRTLVLWTNDNGAPRRDPPQGSNLPLAGWGYSTTEGGMRVPLVARWPGRIPTGQTCRELVTLMDLLPTLESAARSSGGLPPSQKQDTDAAGGRLIDGRNIWPLLSGQPGARSPHNAFYYYYMDQLQAVRSGAWKLYLPLSRVRRGNQIANQTVPARLYNLADDLGESRNLADEHPEIVTRLLALAETARDDLGDLDRPGKNVRPPGRVEQPLPQRLR